MGINAGKIAQGERSGWLRPSMAEDGSRDFGMA